MPIGFRVGSDQNSWWNITKLTMALGKGRYDDLCTDAREKSKGRGAILIILEGEKGFGFSVQAGIQDLLVLPNILRIVAGNIEEDLKKGKL